MTTVAPAESAATNGTRNAPLLEVHDLCKYFPVKRGILSMVKDWVKAVDGVSFSIDSGKTLSLVGESGCGKTTVGRTLLRLISATRGSVLFQGRNILTMDRSELQELRQEMQIIFQDPFGSLNPRMTIGGILGEPLRVHLKLRGSELQDRLTELLDQVGMQPAALARYPHEFSGGQRQRIGIARALALNPAFIVCDEPTSALDVSIRAQIINLLQDLQQTKGLSYLMISHDLAVVRQISHEVAVMYLGKIVEQGPTDELYAAPRHPYTRVLLSAIPVTNPSKRNTSRVRTMDRDDTVPSPINVPPGCAFHPRCPLYMEKGSPEICRTEIPELVQIGGSSQRAACHFAQEG